MVRDIKRYGSPAGRESAFIQGPDYRFTVLTSSLIRMEYNEKGNFEDRATQIVMNRDFQVPEFDVIKENGILTITTEFLQVKYRGGKFAEEGLSIRTILNQETGENRLWRWGDEIKDLGGTARTLDEVDGAISLEHGMISKDGCTLIDDSASMVITEDGWVTPRGGDGLDVYFFGYGRRYQECIRDFYRLCGNTPLLPRWALGNWWSRYHKYTEEEYKRLMVRFQRERIPFSVAVIDMDWHLVDIPAKYGSGWTGYTWNKELFPDPPEFLAWLHEQGLKVTLNVHPADGVRAHEEAYPRMAKALGIDPDSEKTVEFDVTDRRFLEAYFDVLHHPMEGEGVDFWWVDWQQGKKTRIPGLDPLWMLNHYHYLDSTRKGGAGLTFSRYAGIGSHRYPVGFSGDTIISWESLRFQPYFTASASNVGYGWWSHDIGGHMMGARDDELAVRWVQLGVFSPINRLHSTSNPFSGKEPWNFNKRAEMIMKDFLRLRHELIPYLHTANRRASLEGCPLIRPLYWEEPEQKEAYEFPNEYYFGSELLVIPITERLDREADLAGAKAWIPEGLWFDYQNSRIYQGGKQMTLYRTLEQMPVLAKAGAIIPRSLDGKGSTENPDCMAVDIFPGADGCFTIWEDDGRTDGDTVERWVSTRLVLEWGSSVRFAVSGAEGNRSAIPQRRSWKLNFRNVEFADSGFAVPAVNIGGSRTDAALSYDEASKILTLELSEIPTEKNIEVCFETGMRVAAADRVDQAYEILNRAQISYDKKEAMFEAVKKQRGNALLTILSMEENTTLTGALAEIMSDPLP